MQRPGNVKVGDMFRVIEKDSYFLVGEIITFKRDDGTNYPYFWNADGSDYNYISFSRIEPYPKTIRDVQVGDVVVGKTWPGERMVLERGQNTVVLSHYNNFKKADNNYHFDELEQYNTLKDAPEVVDVSVVLTMNQIAEKFGIEVSRLKITKE